LLSELQNEQKFHIFSGESPRISLKIESIWF